MRSRTGGWSSSLPIDTAADVVGAPPPPPEAAAVFGDALPLVRRYADLLAGPGVVRGLLGPREVPRLWARHLLNCAALGELVPPGSSVVDLGSGAGLPGLVMALMRPDVTVALVEPLLRRTTFLGECISDLGISNARVVRGRAEDLAGTLAADVVTARAVAPLARLAGLAVGLVRPGGQILAVKGARAEEEVAHARPGFRRLGIQDVNVVYAGGGRVDPAVTVVRLTVGP